MIESQIPAVLAFLVMAKPAAEINISLNSFVSEISSENM